MSQSDERKNYFATRSCVPATLVSVYCYFKFQGRRSDLGEWIAVSMQDCKSVFTNLAQYALDTH